MDIGTSPANVFSSVDRKVSLLLHAEAGNTDTIRISGRDPTVQTDFDELLAGQDLSIENFTGAIYALANSGTQKLHVPFVNYEPEALQK